MGSATRYFCHPSAVVIDQQVADYLRDAKRLFRMQADGDTGLKVQWLVPVKNNAGQTGWTAVDLKPEHTLAERVSGQLLRMSEFGLSLDESREPCQGFARAIRVS